MQPKFTDAAGHEFTPHELIGATAAHGKGLGTVRQISETPGYPTMVICHTYNGVRDWRLDECTICLGMTTNN